MTITFAVYKDLILLIMSSKPARNYCNKLVLLVHIIRMYLKHLFFFGRNSKEDSITFFQVDSRVKMPSVSDVSGNKSVSIFRVWSTVLVLPNHQHTVKIGTELLPEHGKPSHLDAALRLRRFHRILSP